MESKDDRFLTIPKKSGCKDGDFKPFSAPDGDEDTWSEIATKKFDVNARAHYALLQALKVMILLW